VVVTPAPGAPGAVPFWKGDGLGRPKELGAAIGAFSRWAVDQSAQTLQREYDLDPLAARNLLDYLREQQAATRVVPSDRTIVLERFRDEIGDWRLCVLSPYGGRIHTAWGLAIAARVRDTLGLECDAISGDDGIVVHLPDADDLESMDLAELVLIDPEELEDAVVAELSSTALFGARFREAAARALLIPRAYPGKRTPLWQQRLKSQTLLEVARRYGEFPIVLETYRECLRDVLDLPGLRELLAGLARRELSLVEVQTDTASPFASSLLFDYVATYMYEGDTPNAERRAAALSLDRDLLRELLGQEELRDLIDAGALERLEEDLQLLSAQLLLATRDELHDALRRLGDLTPAEIAQRVLGGVDGAALLAGLEGERRAVRLRIGCEPRAIDAADAGLYRDALGAMPPGGLPQAFLEEVPDALAALLRRYAATHGPFTTVQIAARYGVGVGALEPALRELERAGTIVRGELRPGGSEREWCDAGVLRRLRRASLAALRKEIEPSERRAFAAFLPAWHGIDGHRSGAGADGVARLREQLVPLQGLALPAQTWEQDVLPRRLGTYSPAWMDALCASGELVWVGAGARGRHSGRVALLFREDAALLGPPWSARPPVPPAEDAHELVRARLAGGACFFTDLLVDVEIEPQALQEALWDLVWAGEVSNDAFAPLRAPRLTLAQSALRARRSGRRFSGRRGGAQASPPGRWSLTAPLFLAAGATGAGDPSLRRRAIAELLLERHGILTRELVLAEGVPGGFAAIYPELCRLETLGVATRGYFVEGLGGAQFALPGAVERLRAQRPEATAALVLAANDPAQPYGAALPWPGRAAERPAEDRHAERRPANRPAGGHVADDRPAEDRPASESSLARGRRSRGGRSADSYVVLVGAEPVLYLERGGRALQTFAAAGDPRVATALRALAEQARAGSPRRIALERVDGEPVLGSRWETALIEVGFRAGPRRLTLSG
jgi:ATP-dependent Lhr-like helicase